MTERIVMVEALIPIRVTIEEHDDDDGLPGPSVTGNHMTGNRGPLGRSWNWHADGEQIARALHWEPGDLEWAIREKVRQGDFYTEDEAAPPADHAFPARGTLELDE